MRPVVKTFAIFCPWLDMSNQLPSGSCFDWSLSGYSMSPISP